jgi:beta-glucosidase/6-phospho-beta-glucosidase/beta-galactosidase
MGRGKAEVARTASTWHLEPFVTLNHFTVPLSTPGPLSENRMAAINSGVSYGETVNSQPDLNR